VNILEEIVESRRRDVLETQKLFPIETLQCPTTPHRSLRARLLKGDSPLIIAELKKASPSAGLLRPDYDPTGIAIRYAQAGATAISVLTEPKYFMGSPDHLRAVRAAVDIPILRKDFMCESYQLHEAAAWDADIVLLIATVLPPDELQRLYHEATALGLEVIVEIHNEDELPTALACEQAIIGVNSRNLTTMKTDLAVARTMASAIPTDRPSVAESGIRERSEIEELYELGYDAFLIGEALMRGDDPAGRLAVLLGA
jgi:indole-3-glycerol phosphate synthase